MRYLVAVLVCLFLVTVSLVFPSPPDVRTLGSVGTVDGVAYYTVVPLTARDGCVYYTLSQAFDAGNGRVMLVLSTVCRQGCPRQGVHDFSPGQSLGIMWQESEDSPMHDGVAVLVSCPGPVRSVSGSFRHIYYALDTGHDLATIMLYSSDTGRLLYAGPVVPRR